MELRLDQLRVCLIGDFSGNPDEGLKNSAIGTYEALRRRCEVTKLQVTDVRRPSFWRTLREAKPNLVHFIPGPTVLGLACVRTAAKVVGARSVITASRPRIPFVLQGIARALRPDLALVHAPDQEELFRSLGSMVRFVAPGVDTERFRPPTPGEKQRLREKHNIPEAATVALHAGHLKPSRNLLALEQASKHGIHLVVLASDYLHVDRTIERRLLDSGVDVRVGYCPDIADFYRLADVYVWTPLLTDSISVPLSVLEARAAGLPVVATPFPGLRHRYAGDPAVLFAPPDRILEGVLTLREKGFPPTAPDQRSWAEVGDDIAAAYQELVRSAA